jgi:predicted membrane-bound mannosyltransferase
MNLIEKKAREVYFAVYDEAVALGISMETSTTLAEVASAEIYRKWNDVKRVLTKWLRRCVLAVAVAVSATFVAFCLTMIVITLLPQ